MNADLIRYICINAKFVQIPNMLSVWVLHIWQETDWDTEDQYPVPPPPVLIC
jgi:hypothetical protein